MGLFWQTTFSFPTVIFTLLLALSLLYWLASIIGLLDVDVVEGGDMDVSPEVGDGWQGSFSALLLKLGLGGVPLTVIFTLLFLCGWIICYFIDLLLLHLLPLGWLRYPLGVILLVAALIPSVVLTGWLCRPLRGLFRKYQAVSMKHLLGQTAIVRSGTVTERSGEALLEDGGAGLLLKVRTAGGAGFQRGDRVVLLEYLAAENAYRVISEDEFKGV